MVTIEHDGQNVVVKLTGTVPVSGIYWTAKIDVGSKQYAMLLVDNLNTHMRDKLAAARQAAYTDGYLAGKMKKVKLTWFSGRW